MAQAALDTGEIYARRFFKETTTVFAALVAVAIVGFLFRVFLARSLGATNFGLFVYVFAFVSIISIFRDLGVGQSIIKHIPEFAARKQYGHLRSSIVVYAFIQAIFTISAGTILFIYADQIAIKFFETLEASLIIKFLSGWLILWAIYSAFMAVFQGFREMTPYSLLMFLGTFFPFIFALFSIRTLGANAANVGFAYLMGAGLAALVALGLFLKKHKKVLEYKTKISKQLFKMLFAFALPVLIADIVNIILGHLNTIFVAKFHSFSDAGLYQIAYPIAGVLQYFPIAIGTVLFPMTSELWARREKEILIHATHTITKFAFVFIMPVALIILAFPEVVINLIFGSEYTGASFALQILMLYVIFGTISTVPKKVILGIGKSAVNTFITGIIGIAALILIIILVPFYSIAGAAAALFVSTLIGLSLYLYFSRKYIKAAIPFSSLAKTLVGGLLTLLLVAGLKAIIDLPALLEVAVIIVPGLLFYGFWVLFTRTLELRDLLLMKKTLPIPRWVLRIAKKFVR